MPEFAAVQDRGIQDFKDQRREQFNESFYADLPSRCKIVIEDKLSDDNLMANRVEPQ